MEIKSSNVIARFGVCADTAALSNKIAKEIVQTRFKRKARPPGFIRPNGTDKAAKKVDVLIFARDFQAAKTSAVPGCRAFRHRYARRKSHRFRDDAVHSAD
jgi:hypothetical protein